VNFFFVENLAMDDVVELIQAIKNHIFDRHLNYHRFLSSLNSYQLYLIFLIFCIQINAHTARYILPYLYANPSIDSFHSISVTTNISSFGYGNIIGFGFSLSYVFFGTWVARLIHFHNPKRMLLFGLVAWNVSIYMLTNANSFAKLMGSRIILGLGQAFCTPVCYSFLTHFFPQDDYLPILHSLVSYGSYVGIALSSLLSLSIEEEGWKSCCEYISLSGFLLTMALLFTTPKTAKPIRGKLKKEIKPALHTIEDAFHEIRKNNALLLLLFIGSIRFMLEYVLLSYLPLFFINKFTSFSSHFAISNALFILLTGALISVFQSAVPGSGLLTLDRPGCVYGSCNLLMLLIISTLLAIPTLLLTFLSPNITLSLLGLLLTLLLTDWWFRPFLFVFQRELTPNSRNISLGFLSITTSFFGSTATTVVGYFIGKRDDNLHGNIHVPPHNVTITLVWSCSVILLLSALLFGVITASFLLPLP
jgi:MFS family permease